MVANATTRPQAQPRQLRFRLTAYTYLIAAAAITLWSAAVVATGTWVGDFQLHVATVRTLAADLTHPVDPMVGTGHGSPYYSPYTLLVAAVVRTTGAAPTTILGLFGIVNIAVLLAAFWYFLTTFTRSALAATIAFAALLLLWGPGSPGWSGFTDIRSLAETIPYPSTIGFALMLLLWARLLRFRTAPTLTTAATIGVLASAIALIHPFTAVETAIGAAAILASTALANTSQRLPARGWLWLIAAAALALLLTAAWPYSSLTDLLSAGSSLVDIHRPLRTALLDYPQLICVYGVVALPALALRLRRDRLDPLAFIFAAGALAVAAALITRQHQYLRLIPVMMLPLQVAFGIFVAERTYAPGWARLATGAVALALFAGGLTVNRAPELGVASALPVSWLPESLARQLRTVPIGADPVDRARDFAPAGSTILTDSPWVDRRLNLIGYYSVNPAWPNPWIESPDETTRAADRDTLLNATTTAAVRGEIAQRYRARCVLITRTPAVIATGVDTYRQVHTWRGGALFCR